LIPYMAAEEPAVGDAGQRNALREIGTCGLGLLSGHDGLSLDANACHPRVFPRAHDGADRDGILDADAALRFQNGQQARPSSSDPARADCPPKAELEAVPLQVRFGPIRGYSAWTNQAA